MLSRNLFSLLTVLLVDASDQFIHWVKYSVKITHGVVTLRNSHVLQTNQVANASNA